MKINELSSGYDLALADLIRFNLPSTLLKALIRMRTTRRVNSSDRKGTQDQ